MTDSGVVYLIGAGPGDPGLITVRGLELLRRADVVVYDRLVAPELLRAARADAEMIYVGKAAGQHTMSQDEINALLIDRGRANRMVARLKGGDPFVFGRGGEEALALAAAQVRFEIVPGVTSAIAVPAYAGIPVTHRDIASSVTIVTGHEEPLRAESGVDWHALALSKGTLVFLMGLANLPVIVSQLVANGVVPDMPAAVIERGTTSQQRTALGTLADIEERVRLLQIEPPAIVVVGPVVALSEQLGAWVERYFAKG